MELKNQVVSLELAKKLNKLGVEQESEFAWIDRMINETETNENRIIVLWRDVLSEWEPRCEILCCAFTPAELGEMLPIYISVEKQKKVFKLYIAKDDTGWFIEYQEWSLKVLENYELLVQRTAETEADARAKMLIYLLENDLIKI